jgi:hypothetical protein
MTEPAQFVYSVIPDWAWEQSLKLHRERQMALRELGCSFNYPFVDGDCPECGALSELLFSQWLTAQGVIHFWHWDEPLTKPDFIIQGDDGGDIAIDMKVMNHRERIHANKPQSVRMPHLYHADWFVWGGVYKPTNIFALVGAASREQFLRGEKVNKGTPMGYGVESRRNNSTGPSYQLRIRDFMPIRDWLAYVHDW